MEKFPIILLGAVFVVIIAGLTQTTSADHLEPGQGIFKNENQVNTISSKDSKYEIYLLVELRNAQGQLISVSENLVGKHIPHEIADYTFNENFGEKKIVTIDGVKYEMGRYTQEEVIATQSNAFNFLVTWSIQLCGSFAGHPDACLPVFQTQGGSVYLEEGDIIKSQWIILRVID